MSEKVKQNSDRVETAVPIAKQELHQNDFSSEKELEYIPEFDLEQWQKEMMGRINDVLQRKSKVIVSIAGASASGKGEAAEFLTQQLSQEGRKILTISTDDFYKGISRMVTEKLPDYFPDSGINWQEIERAVSNISADKEFSEKFSEKNLQLLSARLKESYPSIDADQIIAAVKNEFQNLDFDNPAAVDLNSLSEVLERIKENKETEIPIYSMKVSEPGERKKINGADCDIVLIEGIYGLNEKIAGYGDVKSFVEADKRTLLMRRFRRDVLSGRSSFPPEITLWINLEVVLPAYSEHILPDREKSDLILKNDYTGTETFNTKTYDVQDKIPLAEDDISRLEEFLGEPIEAKYQRDYYFTNDDEIFNPEHLIRIREENGKLKDLVHKGTRVQRDDGKIIRPTEVYIKDGEFGVKYKEAAEVISAFHKAGFKLAAEISKTRKIYRKKDIEVALDQIEGLGDYIEIMTNDELSKSPEIDKFKQEIGLTGRRSAGPYADEYFAKIQYDPELIKQQEVMLNQGANKDVILSNDVCEAIEENKEVESAFENLRRGYPDKPLSEQSKGKEFRENAGVVLRSLASKSLTGADPQKVIVLMPWRSGLAFAKSYRECGINKFYHLSSKRDEKTLETMVDFESGEIASEDVVVISDPMLATGNTIVDAIERVKSKGIPTERILINAVVATPVGIQKVKKLYPEIRIIIGSLDEKLDHKGYIVPGLGDFGDKYFANLSPKELDDIVSQFDLDEIGCKKMADRIKKQGVSEVMTALIERDLKDLEIDKLNKEELVNEGLEFQQSKKAITIDTGRIKGIENVVEIIKSNVDKDVKIVALEGKSGAGKSAITEKLRETFNGQIFSMGEIFRYLAYRAIKTGQIHTADILASLSYRIIEGDLKLFDGEVNVSDEFSAELRDKQLEEKLPEIATLSQKGVIEFSQKQISNFKDSATGIIFIEGRSFTLDFLPADLRVRLVADPSIRAERRWAQDFFK